MANIKIESLTKKFESDEESIVAVDEFEMEVDDGEFVVLVGPSGCGKTTTLRCIAGLEDVTSGNIYFDDRRVTDLRGRNRDIAMVFQNYALYPHMTVAKNIGFGLRLTTNLSSEEIDERVNQVARMLSIEKLLDNKPSELSGGQQQRVALGRAIIREPQVFLMDEPLSNLDAKLRTQMRTEIQQLQNDLGITTVYVTHDQTEAMAMGDRIAVMNDGVLQQIGEPEDLYINPTNLFVASFIGSPSMNIIPATVESADNERVQLVGSDTFSYEITDAKEVVDAHQVQVGIRPEDISVSKSEGIPVTVDVLERMGNENFLYLDLDGREIIARVDRTIRPKIGDTVAIMFEQDDLYIFDAETGESLRTKTGEVSIEQTLEIN